ncbi:MAG: hypothetical protein VKN33_02655 [Candidatus Sericytochromatia bacterium]|nr:hypothetical protein [Candidatus Sericytochromatia bacterium]
MTRFFSVLVAAVALGANTGCAGLLGRALLPTVTSQEEPLERIQRFQCPHFLATLRWDGPGQLIPTAYFFWGRIARAVNPYGTDSWLVHVRFETKSTDAMIEIQPAKARIITGKSRLHPALTLTDFRRKWPKWAINSAEEALDRQTAYEHILNTLLIERHLRPVAVDEGWLAFPRVSALQSATVEFPYRINGQTRVASATWEFQ